MGLTISRLQEGFAELAAAFGFNKTEARVLMLGLDAAGKTTILYKLKMNETISTIPTIGFNVETVTPTPSVSFTVWDVGGQDKIRKLWRHYFINTNALLFVVDSADRERFTEARDELARLLQSPELAGVPLVVLANKQDLPAAASPDVLAGKLGLRDITQRDWHIQAVSAPSADGLYEAIDQLAGMVKKAAGRRF